MGSRSSLVVDGISYLVHPQSLLKVTESTGLEPIPVVLLPICDSISSVIDALQLINRFAQVDDGYSPSFSRTAVIRSSSERGFMEMLKRFIFGVIPDDVLNPKRYTALNLLSSNGLWKSIPVPSRLYNSPTSTTPLACARMGIKDIFRLEGTQTTMMSRTWIELYDPDKQSADYTKKLINLGAVITSELTSIAPSILVEMATRAHRAAQQELLLL
ncbi:amidase signature domain-containing protein [Fusarium coicis]|nr:amidase signature domain-containing protein [Fusarium coicis]